MYFTVYIYTINERKSILYQELYNKKLFIKIKSPLNAYNNLKFEKYVLDS